MTPTHDPQRLLRTALFANAGFSTLSGLTFATASGAVATFLGFEHPTEVMMMGFNLLGFAALVAWTASRATIPLRLALAIVVMDGAWVAGTVPVVMADVFGPAGNWTALAIADVVLVFAVAQYVGIRRIRKAGMPATAPAPAAG